MTRWQMIKAGWGSYSEYREACFCAKESGWTLEQVEATLSFTDPLAVIVLWPMTILVVVGVIMLALS